MPSSLNMPLNPLLHSRNILLGILQIFTDIIRLAACHKAIFRWFPRFGVDGPATVLDTCCDVIRAAVGFGVLQVQVFGASGGVVTEESGMVMSVL